MQRPIADLSCLHDIGREIARERAGAAVNFQPITRRQRIDAAKLQYAFRAVFETAQNAEQIRNDHVVPFAHRMNNFPAREHTGDIAEPALQHLDINSQGQSVEPADLYFLPPMRRGVRIQIIAGETLQPHVMWSANVIFGQNLFHYQIRLHSEWRRAKHGHQLWITF